MRIKLIGTLTLVLTLVGAGCGEDDGTSGGGDGGALDGGGDGAAPSDAASGDAGGEDAAGEDANVADAAGEAATDAGGSGCTSNADCGDSEGCYEGACQLVFNGCTRDGATDMTGMAAVTITFECATTCAYTPKCAAVSPGTVVTFEGSFSAHPLVGGTSSGGKQVGGTAPLDGATGASGSSADFTLQDPLAYPYYCDVHALSGMSGALFVE